MRLSVKEPQNLDRVDTPSQSRLRKRVKEQGDPHFTARWSLTHFRGLRLPAQNSFFELEFPESSPH
jgi:hypothetical protein